MAQHGAKLSQIPAGAGLPSISNHGMRRHLFRAGTDHSNHKRHIRRDITDLDRMKIEEQKKAVRSGYDMDILPSDLALYGKEAKSLLNELQSRNERLFLVTFLVLNMQSGTHFAKTGGFRSHGTRLFHACWGAAPIPAEHKIGVLKQWINPSAARFCKSLMGGQLSAALPLFPVVHSLPPAPYPTPEYGRYWPWPSAALSFPHGLCGSRRRLLSYLPAAQRTRYSAP